MPFNCSNKCPVDYLNAQPIYGRVVNHKSFPENVDVLIVGAGPAGLMAATALSIFGISVRIIDQRSEKIMRGQADGIHSRTLEVLETYGLANRILRESSQNWEHSFWSSGEDGVLKRIHRVPNSRTPNARYPFAVAMNQGLIENVLIDVMSTRKILIDRPTKVYNWEMLTHIGKSSDYRVKVTLEHLMHADETHQKKNQVTRLNNSVKDENSVSKSYTTIYAKYVIGCDGAHSWVRKKLGITMDGEHTENVWGVFDCHLETDFPDIRNKVTIKTLHGTCMIIPREGDLVRFYIQLQNLQRIDTGGRIIREQITKEIMIAAVTKMFTPYKINILNIEWWTVYVVGQRCASHFMDENGIVFIVGDACHTHSPKAGQGMNAAINDSHNLAWKLALVIKGFANPTILKTYEVERRSFALQLIDFDRHFAKMYSDEIDGNNENKDNVHEKFCHAFQIYGNFISGFDIRYETSIITSESGENQHLAEGIVIGKNLFSQIIVRHVDGRPFHLHDQMPTDLRFRILIFTGNCLLTSQLERLSEVAISLQKLAERYTPIENHYDDVIDFITISSNAHADYEKECLPIFLRQNIWKIFCDEVAIDGTGGNAYNFYKIDKTFGALIVVRPDGFNAHIASVSACGVNGIANYFGEFLNPQN